MRRVLGIIQSKVYSLPRNQFFIADVLFALGLFLFLFINTIHESYPDECDNILGGTYILKGILPYTGFFSHHGPIAYFVAALIASFSGHSFVGFRIFYSIFLLFF